MDGFDARSEELETIEAIYLDLAVIDAVAFSGKVSIPIDLENPVPVILSSETHVEDSCVTSLPPLQFSFQLPELYPYKEPPEIRISSSAFPPETLGGFCSEMLGIWRNTKDQVLFAMVDFLQQKALEHSKTLVGNYISCKGSRDYYDEILAYDREKSQLAFNASTFTCEICQRGLKGEKCVQFPGCGHVFCRACVRSFFESLIEAGEVEKVHCPEFECGRLALLEREKQLRLDFATQPNFDFENFKRKIMDPPIEAHVLQRILGQTAAGKALFEKYTTIHAAHQHALIAKLFPMRLVACPRSHCPAMIFRENTQDRLVVCRKCEYAFCNTCRKSFHSSSIDCSRKKDERLYHGIAIEDIEVWIADGKSSPAGNELRCKYGHELLKKVADEYTMDKLFNEMLQTELHDFSTCPTCDIVVQRLEGCNKMRCSHCYTFFCHLCSAYLDQDHPYDHFKDKSSSCYNRLFQGMPGTEDLD
ncbi:hypothetical protein METBIDRAFT_9103 [Metschnikowia bicuspidata var. bicuspidata NRRL YB-4993]|uniref:RBR-type E3 ubiquitin transferase n=1 Tax=Metschnikowia bicuspidata var. bicuspidata NRRL YB-4993 TaxID=869754 RepID=A0A1A0HFR5_9ASCO|nr:hypothetical protein METBIDRAFT_9103 [Metschnikowia bicuspidata var. bicuspidata NRRL YB-4993]OBA22737.1 hypothetical protein METBIDRAFT_9103 [Metschnikowia bicuspidata var. bicuspidata NRRL YB-4993]